LKISAVSIVTLQHGLLGGMERYFDHVIDVLDDIGHSVTVVTSDLRGNTTPANPGFKSLPIPIGARLTKWDKALRDYYRDGEADNDVILSNSFAMAPSGSSGPPVVSILQGTGLVDLISAVRVLTWHPRPMVDCMRQILRAAMLHATHRRRLRATTLLVAVSEETKASLMRVYGVAAEKIRVVPAPVDTEVFNSPGRKEFTQPSAIRPFRILTAGTLSRQKGTHFVLEAVGELNRRSPGCYLLTVAGVGSELERLRNLAHELGISSQVSFAGQLDSPHLAQALRGTDLFVLGTLREEGFPLVIAESLASSVPVVATGAGGNPTAVRDGIDGVLVPRGSARQIAATIERLAGNPDLLAEMAQSARRRARKELDFREVGRGIEEVLLEALALEKRNAHPKG
jgi:glycosyltransferase involved in cell wall biosynthesis